jgi:hypothetical protein
MSSGVWNQEVLVSLDGGSTFETTPIFAYTGGGLFDNGEEPAFAERIFDVSGIAAGESQVVFAFRYAGDGNDWWWAIDNVKVSGSGVSPITITVPNGEFLIYKPGTNYTVTATLSGSAYAQGIGDNCNVVGTADYADGTSGEFVDCPGWTGITGKNDLGKNGVDDSVGYSAFGTWSGGSGTTAESSDSLGNIVSGSTYTLSAMVNGPAGPLVLDLLAGGVALTPSSSITPSSPTDGWQEISRTYDAGSVGDYVGQAMTIVIGTPGADLFGSRVVFDAVSLSYAP